MVESLVLKCKARHKVKISKAKYDESAEKGVKIRCKRCSKKYDASEFKVLESFDPEKDAVQESDDSNAAELQQEDSEKVQENANSENPYKEENFTVEKSEGTIEKVQEIADATTPSVSKGKFSEDTIEKVLDILFNSIAAKRGDFWRLSVAEKQQLVPSFTRVVNRHLGGNMGKYGEEIALGIGLGVLFLGRFMMDQRINKDKKQVIEATKTPLHEELEKIQAKTTELSLKEQYPGLY